MKTNNLKIHYQWIYGNYYLVFQKCFSTALRKRLSCPDSRASTSRYTCHMSMMFSFSERTSITLSPTARIWILNKFPPIFFGREKNFCQVFRVVKNDAKYASKFDKKKHFFILLMTCSWIYASYGHVNYIIRFLGCFYIIKKQWKLFALNFD